MVLRLVSGRFRAGLGIVWACLGLFGRVERFIRVS